MLVAVKVARFLLINATNLKSSKTQFQFELSLSLAQLSPSLSILGIILCEGEASHSKLPTYSQQTAEILMIRQD